MASNTSACCVYSCPHAALAVQAIHNLCKVSKDRQSEAASAGVTQALTKLYSAQPGPGGTRSRAAAPKTPEAVETALKIRGLCISLLTALVHSNSKTRAELWQCQGLELFVDLLSEPEWQRQALEALAVWLLEDTPRVEPKLLVKRNVQARRLPLAEAFAPALPEA